ncbi:MAG: hypothetical protein AABX19_02225 [Nanoarchaeota archaeon]
MDNKKVGLIFLAFGILLVGILLDYDYINSNKVYSCDIDNNCLPVNSVFTITNIFIAIISCLLTLGVYMIFFSKGEEILIKKLDENNKKLSDDEKFGILFKALTKDEQDIIKIVKNEEGITQSTLRIRTDMSKAKLSFVLSDLEKKKLIIKELYGKTNKIFLKQSI